MGQRVMEERCVSPPGVFMNRFSSARCRVSQHRHPENRAHSDEARRKVCTGRHRSDALFEVIAQRFELLPAVFALQHVEAGEPGAHRYRIT